MHTAARNICRSSRLARRCYPPFAMQTNPLCRQSHLMHLSAHYSLCTSPNYSRDETWFAQLRNAPSSTALKASVPRHNHTSVSNMLNLTLHCPSFSSTSCLYQLLVKSPPCCQHSAACSHMPQHIPCVPNSCRSQWHPIRFLSS